MPKLIRSSWQTEGASWRVGVIIFVVFCVCYSLFSVLRIASSARLQDFAVYYQGAVDSLAHRNPYLVDAVDTPINPPSALVLEVPVALLPFSWAQLTWTVGSYIALLGALYLLSTLTEKKARRKVFWGLFCASVLAFPVKFTLGMGQVNLYVLFLVVCSFFLFQKKHLMFAGIVLGVAAAIKLAPLLLVLFFVRKKCWQTAMSMLLTFGLLQALGALVYGPAVTLQYWTHVFPQLPTVGNAVYYNQALTGFLARALIPEHFARFINYSTLVLLSLSSFLLTSRRKRPTVFELGEYGLLVLVGLLTGGLAWQHHFVLAIIPLSAVWLLRGQLAHQQRIWVTVGTICAYVLLATNIASPDRFRGYLPSVTWLSHVFWGGILLFGLLAWLLRNTDRVSDQKQTELN